MLLVIGWVVWVLYQIAPRSVVTPLAYANQDRHIVTQRSATGAVAPATQVGAVALSATQPAPAADPAMEQAQASARSGTHQASADVQAAVIEKKEGQIKGEGLRLATEISTPLAEKPSILTTQEAKLQGAPPFPQRGAQPGKTGVRSAPSRESA